ncbi:MAG TPA: GIY-YIG nuclease family protein [Bradyrhizobium sp.]|nr:GIY-YIG nuclease family protein [Bradyrhizobium sp.]
MHQQAFDALVDELSSFGQMSPLPADWIICTDSDVLRDIQTIAERRKLLKRAKAELIRRRIQERIDEIAEAWDSEDSAMVEVLLEAFPNDLEIYKAALRPSQLRKWIDKASLAACGRIDESETDQPVVYFVSIDQNQELIKIGHTTNLTSRLSSLRTGSPNELQVHLVIPGSRDYEQELHRKFASLRMRGEWFRRAKAIDDFIALHRKSTDSVSYPPSAPR